MNPLVGVAISLLPELLDVLKKSGAVDRLSDKIAGIVSDTTKADTPGKATAAIEADPQVKSDLRVRLAELALEQQRASLDADDKRDTQANVSTAGAHSAIRAQMDKSLLLSITPAAISYMIVVGFFVVLAVMAMGKVGITAGPDLDKLTAVAAALNSRPRRTLNWKTPAEALDAVLASVQDDVATTA